MESLPPLATLLILGVGAVAVLAMLYVLAARSRDEMRIVELREETLALREEYLQRIEAHRSGDPEAELTPSRVG